MIHPLRAGIACAGLIVPIGSLAMSSLADCAALDADAARLACYDKLVGRTDHPADEPRASLLSENWELAGNSALFHLRRYKPVYLLPYFNTSRTNPTPSSPSLGVASSSPAQIDSTEAKYQLSFKTKIFNDIFGSNGDLWGAYTQSSRWQLYNREHSRAFRETNYEPEVMFVWRTNEGILGMRARYLALGINHQSNGQGGAMSRSWDRIIGAIAFERGPWTLTLRPWWRVEVLGSEDDNPDMSDYAGRGEMLVTRVFGSHVLSLEARHSLRGGDRSHGSLRADWAFPINDRLKGHIQLFNGYAESLIDYNHRATYLGVGFSLAEWH